MRGFRAWLRDPPGGCPHYMDLGPRIQPNLTHICADSECSRSVFAQIRLQLWHLGTPSPFLPRNCGHFPCPLPSLTHKVSSTFRDCETISPAKDGKALQAPAHVQVPAPCPPCVHKDLLVLPAQSMCMLWNLGALLDSRMGSLTTWQ